MNIVRSSKKFTKLGVVLFLLSGCQARFLTFTHRPDQAGVVGSFQSVDFFKTTRPSKICGKSGWQFLQREFFGPQCGSCHGDTPLAPYVFNSSDPDISYAAATSVPVSILLSTSQNNKFLPTTSHLDPTGEVYQGIVEWSRQEFNCP